MIDAASGAPNAGRVAPALRAIRPDDAGAIARIANLPGYRRGTLRIPFTPAEHWQKRIAASGDQTWIVAELDGAVVGHGALMPRTAPRLAHVGEIVMGVDDAFVGRGIGSAILAALLDVADNWRGLKRIELEVYVDNEPAIRLYRRHGFEIEGRRVKSAFTDGAYVDTLVMARLRF
jgi:putative acetyltransferase